MKSNGLAQRIHVSEQAYHELKKTSNFAIGYRGIVPLKNRGDMKARHFYIITFHIVWSIFMVILSSNNMGP